MNISSVAIQKALIRRLVRHPGMLNYAQKARYLVFRGPLQGRFVRYYQRRSVTTPIALSGPSAFPELNVEKALAELNETGFSQAFEISARQLQKIIAYQNSAKSDHLHEAHKRCEFLDQIIRDPRVVEVVKQYIGAEPIIYACSIYLTGPQPGLTAPAKRSPRKEVHFDANDFRDVNLFIYLNDVDEEASPHYFIEGTHRKKRFRDLVTRWYTREEMQRRFGSRIKMVTGRAGTAFFEDTSVFHIQSVGTRGRYTVAVCYTLQRKPELARHNG